MIYRKASPGLLIGDYLGAFDEGRKICIFSS